MDAGVLYHRTKMDGGKENKQLVLPKVLQVQILKSLHDDHGHQGIERTLQLVRRRCYWPGMGKSVEQWCKECERCTLSKVVQPRIQTFMGNLLASQPLEILAIDFTVLEPSWDGKENILVLTDVFYSCMGSRRAVQLTHREMVSVSGSIELCTTCCALSLQRRSQSFSPRCCLPITPQSIRQQVGLHIT